MEVKLDRRYPLEVSAEQAWAVLGDIRAVANCMPGAQVTEQLGDARYRGSVRTKVGPALMQFGGEVEVRGLDSASRSLALYAKGTDRSGTSAAMNLAAHLEEGATASTAVLVGSATVTVSGKLAQFGNRLLVPVSDAMLAQFADNFRTAAAAVQTARAQPLPVIDGEENTVMRMVNRAQQPAPDGSEPAAAQVDPTLRTAQAGRGVKELNAMALLWAAFKSWLASLFRNRA